MYVLDNSFFLWFYLVSSLRNVENWKIAKFTILTPKKVLMLVYVVSQIKGLKINDDQMIPTANPPKPFPIVFLEN